MINDSPVVFISRVFFQHFCMIWHGSWHEYSFKKRQIIMFLEELIFHRGHLYFNMSDEEIRELSNMTENEASERFHGRNILFYLEFKRLLMKGMKIESCVHEFKQYELMEAEKLSEGTIRPNYILMNALQPMTYTLSKAYGIVCVGKDLDIQSNSVFEIYLKSFEKDVISNMPIYFKQVPPCHSIIIQDPYILKEGKAYIKSLITHLLNSANLKVRPCITFFVRPGEGSETIIDEISKEIEDRCDVELVKSMNFHDRNIYTNTAWISSDYGFRNNYTKGSTKWCAFPLSRYYEEYRCNLIYIKKYINSIHKQTSKNSMIA